MTERSKKSKSRINRRGGEGKGVGREGKGVGGEGKGVGREVKERNDSRVEKTNEKKKVNKEGKM